MPLLLTDLDDTIGDRASAFGRWAIRFLSDRGLEADAVAWLHEIDRHGFEPRASFFGAVRERFGLQDAVEDLIEHYDEVFPRAYRSFPGVRSALEDLRREGWTVVIVTNGSARQRDKLRYAGIADVIDGCCISEVVGFRKPDPRIFEVAAAGCGQALEGAWMVGDALVDVEGARVAGIRSAWIHHGRTWEERAFAPDITAGSFVEAVRAIQERA